MEHSAGEPRIPVEDRVWEKPLDRGALAARTADRNLVAPHSWAMPVLIALHVPLALLMRRSPTISTIHALATILFGLRCAAMGNLDRVAYLGAYIAGAEVLWRMTDARIFWETGKYASSLIFLVALAGMRGRRLPVLPLLYFGLLLPSTVMVLGEYDPGEFRDQVSFYMSGPFSLMVAACFYANLGLSRSELTRIFLTLLAPIVGISTIAIFGIATAESITFGTESNFATSGGFGPNQVSTLLGIGSLSALLCVLIEEKRRTFRWVALVMTIALATQSALTFSRTGLYLVGLGSLATILSMTTNPTILLRSLLAVVLILAAAYFLIIPALDDFTGGAITARFTEKNTSHRGEFMMDDVELWMKYPIMGVGPGGSRIAHGTMNAASHSEASRHLVEHGLFGLAALLLLGIMGLRNCARSETILTRGVRVALVVGCLLLVASNGVRVFVPGFMFGLSFVTILPDQATEALR